MTGSSPPLDSPDSPPLPRSITKAAGLISLSTFASRILGFARDMLLAKLFGAGAAADAFYVAYRIPNLLRELLAEGSISSAFIPVFTEYHTLRTKQETWELASAAFTTLLTIATAVTMIGIFCAPSLVWLIAPGFREDEARLATTTLLTQLMFPYLLFVSLAALAMGILNSLGAFAVPALAPVFFNLCIITFAVGIAPLFDQPIFGVAIGVVVGGAAQFLMQLPALQRHGLLFGWRFLPTHPGIRRMGRLIVPTLLGFSVTQVNITVNTILSSHFPGGPTYLFYAMRLIQFPLGLFGVALATATLPTLSAHAARGDLPALRDTLEEALRMIAFVIVPAMVGLILLRKPIIHVIFEHGAFTPADTIHTASALFAFAIGLWAFAGYRIVATAFYALQDTFTPASAAVIGMISNILLALGLMHAFAHAGLALATALAAMVNVGILVLLLGRRVGSFRWAMLGRTLWRIVIALIPMVVVCVWITDLAVWNRADQWIAKIIMLGVGIGLSLTGYIGIHALFKSEELEKIWAMLNSKIRLGERTR
ncbi:MAG: murein biosynthesis integral membrane protein MurJ [Nitrospirae bacterium]|nr:MAG: murein biosynthesis integral membrane protein MurJ [Nitrospirota bacterium]